ncbi:ABC transporter substrate-binding protein [Palleronia caenipelagi]|uniref:ABC transporter substrate-binding protein n=1 Tax=Palleronia caenipelagi TaxID=2489174 RepID=A0A547QA61_9RHOB|nr:ABC transporter substrate-binding protein [Palleronia caenipelagi]TRD23262.1 ABC transporter substrate-binding protein [Palleronia caenipelagi]
MKKELDMLARKALQGQLGRRDFMARAAALGLTASAASSLLGQPASAQPVKGGTLRMGLGGGESTNSLDPAAALSQVPFHTSRTFGETLVDVNPDGSFDFRLAESVEPSADATTWAFRIRKGVEFHNGQTLTPDDVLQTMRRHSDENTQSGALGVMRGIADMRLDGDMFIVECTTPNADLPYLMSSYQLVIQPGGGFENPAAGIGTGAYKVTAEEPGVRYMFERFGNYWDDSRGHFDAVEMLVINDSTARNAALQSGQVHIVNLVEPQVARLLDRAPGLSVKSVAGRGHYVFIMHCNTAPFDNKDLRLALKYAINREEMVERILSGYGTVGNDIPINAAYPLFDASIPQRTYDPEKAAEHYKKSGHDGSPIVLQVADAAFPGAVDAAQLFQQSAAAAGIPLEIKREPDDGYWSEVWNKQPFCASYWGGRPVQDQMYSTAYLSKADWNDTRYFDETFDKLLLEARGELDDTKRKALYSEMANMVRDDGGLICPMFNDFVEGVRDEVQGWEQNGIWEVMNGSAPSRCWFA